MIHSGTQVLNNFSHLFNESNFLITFVLSGYFVDNGDGTFKSHFKNQSLGINEMYKIPKYMAEICGYPNPERFTGHSLRRTSITIMADRGASGAQLRNKANHASEKGTVIII